MPKKRRLRVATVMAWRVTREKVSWTTGWTAPALYKVRAVCNTLKGDATATMYEYELWHALPSYAESSDPAFSPFFTARQCMA